MDNGLTIAMIVGLLSVALGVLLIALRAGVDREADKAGTRRALLDIGRLRASFAHAVRTIAVFYNHLTPPNTLPRYTT